MTKLIETLAISGTLVLFPATARPQEDDGAISAETDAGMGAWVAPPSAQPPSERPPAPSYESNPVPPAQVEVQASVPPGQWVYTQQYGWIWMPYSDAFTHTPASGWGEPYAYVYYPTYGWTWLAAPWVWGVGPWPFFGAFGPARFSWYSHGWWREPARWHYAPYHGGHRSFAPAPAHRGGWYGAARPVPHRGGAWYRGGARPTPHGGSASGGGWRGGPAPHGGFMGRGGFGTGGGHGGGGGAAPGFGGHGGGGHGGGGHGGGGHGGGGHGGGGHGGGGHGGGGHGGGGHGGGGH